MNRLDSSLRYRVRTLSCVLFLGGLVGIIDPVVSWGVPPRTLLAFLGGVILWMILPFLRWTHDVRTSMFMAVATTFIVFQGCFVVYGDPFYIMLGFAVPVGAALFMPAKDAAIVLALYCVTAISISLVIWNGWLVPPFAIEGADLGLNVKQTFTGVSVVAAIAISTIWKEMLFAGPTERERIQQRRFEVVCENGYDAFVEADELGMITFANGKLLEDLGFTSEVLIGKKQLEMIGVRNRAEFLRNVKFDNDFYSYDLETKIYDAKKNTHWVRVSGGNVDDEFGGRKWIHGIRSIEGQIKQRERLFEVSRLESLGSVCGGLAHDFNNLLTVIGIHADQIAESDVKESILRAQSEATDLTSGLLTFARKQEFRKQEIVLSQFLIESLLLVKKLIKENIQFQSKIDCGDAIVTIDPAQLQQVLINLVSNSDHAMPHGGTLQITAEKVDVLPDAVLNLSDTEHNYIVVNVSDSGEGMSEEIKMRALEPFYTTKPRGKGTGLGLAMVHGIVNYAGGMISIMTQPNSGTTVSLFLPYHLDFTNKIHKPHFTSCPAANPLNINVLLVEDRELVRKAIGSGLESHGAQVTTCSNAEDAFDIVASNTVFDFIVTDLVLPGMSGIELIQKAVGLNNQVKVVLISGHQQQDLSFVNSHPQNVKFLSKPFQMQQLLDVFESFPEDIRDVPEICQQNKPT